MTTAAINPAPETGVTLAPSTGVKTPTPTTPTTAAAGGYQTYTNRRFGYTVQIPANFTPGDPPANGDGLEFSSPDRSASVSLAGEHNALNQTVDNEYAQAQQTSHPEFCQAATVCVVIWWCCQAVFSS